MRIDQNNMLRIRRIKRKDLLMDIALLICQKWVMILENLWNLKKIRKRNDCFYFLFFEKKKIIFIKNHSKFQKISFYGSAMIYYIKKVFV